MKIIKLFALGCLFLTSSFSYAKDRPIIKNLMATSGKGTKINISWTVPEKPDPKITKLFLYRTTKPAGSFFDLESEKPIATLDADCCGFTDSVKDYRDYYYAVLAEVNGKPYDIILPSINSTVNSVHLKIEQKEELPVKKEIPEKLYTDGNIRETPLPFLDLVSSMKGKKISMKESTISYARELAGNSQKTKKRLTPYVFEQDLISPDGGDDFLLFEILRTTFIQKKYASCIDELIKLLGTNRSAEVTQRAGFYLAQSYYFSKDYKSAVQNFLKVYDTFPNLSKKWIDSSLEYMETME